jgi:hypothetical protein
MHDAAIVAQALLELEVERRGAAFVDGRAVKGRARHGRQGRDRRRVVSVWRRTRSPMGVGRLGAAAAAEEDEDENEDVEDEVDEEEDAEDEGAAPAAA